ncbi:MFS transporter [Zobellella endophytica]|uniref:MFS transporter n=1 Tax=Zobellella endophytica TaxID=2116700 RepID=A0A2P7RBE6_9GAMM|nr:efflux RND transporter permease subunit [Zobellella endophytica]PSJ47493.1 MFS transporter [Zobellella endophytica]
MRVLIQAAVERSRATLMVFVFLLLGGYTAQQLIPKEAAPDVTIPRMNVSVKLEGISPEDADRLLVRPMEQELRSLAGIRSMTSTASEGQGVVSLEFDAGFNPRQALQDVQEKVNALRGKLPEKAESPRVQEINVALFPVLSLALSGRLTEAELVTIARKMKLAIESIPEVLEVVIAGDREEVVDIVVDPQVLDRYHIDYQQLFNLVSRNNQLVAAGNLETDTGLLAVKVPGVIESLEDILSLPIRVEGDIVITFGEVALLQRGFKAPTSLARINGEPGVVLEISKRTGANIIDTIDKVKARVAEAGTRLPDGVSINYIMDQSVRIDAMLDDLLNNVLTAVVLVLVLIIATMGLRAAVMVGLTIPGAFLCGLLMIWAIGYTLNVIVLFALIMVAGMLVDGAIVISELADRNLHQGQSPRAAWINAAHRMSWPVFASTATTLVVFLPMLFWPGVVGEFMKYLPATIILCLLASLAMALIFLPAMGGVSRYRPRRGEPIYVPGLTLYRALLSRLLRRPGLALAGTLLVIGVIYTAYGRFHHGVEFFPSIEPDSAQLQVRARGDLSLHEKDRILREVEQRLLGLSEVRALYARSLATPGHQMGTDVIGVLQFQMTDWHRRRPAAEIEQSIAALTRDIPGIVLEFREQKQGPARGKPVELQISSTDGTPPGPFVDELRTLMGRLGGFTDIEDNRALPGIEWRIEVDRAAAARMGADILSVGNAVQLVTNGLKLASYRPEAVPDEVDIRVRLPQGWRSLDQFSRLSLTTERGQVPLAHFVTLTPAPKTGRIHRIDGLQAVTLKADIAPGYRLDERLAALRPYLAQLPPEIGLAFGGEDADRREAGTFLLAAFGVAIFLMMLILVLQFNSLYQTALVLSAIVLSTAGVLMGLLLNGQPFGIVMVGMGIIALAGIVVNNNIVLIDTFNQLIAEGMSPPEAALETGCLRLRPVLLTALTTVLGLMPMVLGVNIDLLAPSLGVGAPSTQWWTQLSSAIAGGLTFATLLTLLLTPCLLLWGARSRPPPSA